VFLSYWVSMWMHRAFPAAPALVIACSVVLSALGAGLLSVVIQWAVYEPIRREPRTRAIISRSRCRYCAEHRYSVFGAHTRLPAIVEASTGRLLTIAGLAVSPRRFADRGAPHEVGIRARATAENPGVVELMGISPALVTTVVFLLAEPWRESPGRAGDLLYGTVQPQMGFQPALKAFMIGVLGTPRQSNRCRRCRCGTRIVESLALAYLPSGYSQYRDPLVFALLFACLV